MVVMSIGFLPAVVRLWAYDEQKRGTKMSVKWVLSIAAFLCLGVAAAHSQTTLEGIKKRGELVAGVRYDMPPFGYVSEGGAVAGIDIEIVNELAKRIGVPLRLVQVTAQSRIPMLQNGTVDLLAAGVARTEEREKVVDFSADYFISGTRFLVKDDSSAETYKDFEGKTIATVQGTPYLPLLVGKGLKFEPLTFQEYPQAMLAVANGKADALVADDATLATVFQQAKGMKIVGRAADFPSWNIALAIQKNSNEWKQYLNSVLAEMWERNVLQEAARKQGLAYDSGFQIQQ